MEEKKLKGSLVYVVIRYGQLIGVYSNQDDAMQVVSEAIAKGHPADICPRAIL